MAGGSHHHMMMLACRFDAALVSSPTHHAGLVAQATFEGLVPSDDVTSLGREISLYILIYISLQLSFILQPQLLHLGLALAAFLPSGTRALITTYMNQFARKHLTHLVHHLMQEVQGLGIASTKHVRRNSPLSPYLIGTSCTTQFGINAECGHHMSGKVYLGNDGNEPFGCIAHYLLHLLLGIIARLGSIVIERIGRIVQSQVLADDGVRANTCLGSQFGQGLHLESPSLIIGQMPMETVHSMQSQYIYKLLDESHGEEVAGAIKFRATVGKSRFVGDGHIRQSQRIALLSRQALAKCLQSIEDSALAGSLNADSLLVYPDGIGLGITALQAQSELQSCFDLLARLASRE